MAHKMSGRLIVNPMSTQITKSFHCSYYIFNHRGNLTRNLMGNPMGNHQVLLLDNLMHNLQGTMRYIQRAT